MSATQLKTNIVNKTKPGVDKLIDSLIDFAKPMTTKQLFETTNKALISSRAMALIAMAKDTARKEEHAAAEASDEDIDVDDLLLLEEEELPSNDVNPQQDAAGYEPEKDEEDEMMRRMRRMTHSISFVLPISRKCAMPNLTLVLHIR